MCLDLCKNERMKGKKKGEGERKKEKYILTSKQYYSPLNNKDLTYSSRFARNFRFEERELL